jgi:hypothetical protein
MIAGNADVVLALSTKISTDWWNNFLLERCPGALARPRFECIPCTACTVFVNAPALRISLRDTPIFNPYESCVETRSRAAGVDATIACSRVRRRKATHP